jgi:hypothetical protein
MQAGDELAGDEFTQAIPPGSPMSAQGLLDAPMPGVAAPQPGTGLAWHVNPERLARAYDQARSGMLTTDGSPPNSVLVMKVALVIYDHLTEVEGAAQKPLERP